MKVITANERQTQSFHDGTNKEYVWVDSMYGECVCVFSCVCECVCLCVYTKGFREVYSCLPWRIYRRNIEKYQKKERGRCGVTHVQTHMISLQSQISVHMNATANLTCKDKSDDSLFFLILLIQNRQMTKPKPVINWSQLLCIQKQIPSIEIFLISYWLNP